MKNKKLLGVMAAVSLVAVVGIGGTLAYLTSVTDEKTNTFTMGEGIEGEIDEPSWDPEEGKDFYPGKVIAKDPIIKNISAETTDAAFVAATITYQVQDENGNWVDATYDELDNFINVCGLDTTNWTYSEDMTCAYYNSKLEAQTQTTPLFTAVEIDKLALSPAQVESAEGTNVQFDVTKYETTDEEGNVVYTYTTYEMKNFQILVKGYLVQGSDEFADAKTAAETAFPEIFQ